MVVLPSKPLIITSLLVAALVSAAPMPRLGTHQRSPLLARSIAEALDILDSRADSAFASNLIPRAIEPNANQAPTSNVRTQGTSSVTNNVQGNLAEIVEEVATTKHYCNVALKMYATDADKRTGFIEELLKTTDDKAAFMAWLRPLAKDLSGDQTIRHETLKKLRKEADERLQAALKTQSGKPSNSHGRGQSTSSPSTSSSNNPGKK